MPFATIWRRPLVAAVSLTVFFAVAACNAQPSTPVYLFQRGQQQIVARDASGAPILGLALVPHGLARFDRNGALLVRQGQFIAERAEEIWSSALQSGHGSSIELSITPRPEKPSSSTTLLSIGSEDAPAQITVVYTAGGLAATIGNGNAPCRVSLGVPPADGVSHIALVFEEAEVLGYLNGDLVDRCAFDRDRLARENPNVVLGGASAEESGWSGTIDRFALFSTALNAEAIAAHAREEFPKTEPVDTVIVQAELVTKSRVPSIEQLAPYTQSLAIYKYKVKEVLAGDYDAGEIYVAHWTVLDSVRLPFADIADGGTYTLRLEPFSDQPQLETENLSDAVVEDFELPWFYDAGGTSLGFDVVTDAATRNRSRSMTSSQPGSDIGPQDNVQRSEREVAARLKDIQDARGALEAQLARKGGFAAWEQALSPYRADLAASLNSHKRYTLVGANGHLFSRHGLQYLVDDNLAAMPTTEANAAPPSPLVAIVAYHRRLTEQGVDLIYVPVPPREEVYPESLSVDCPADGAVTPQMTQFLLELLAAGVEVVDLRQAFLDEREKHDEFLYPISEVHWGTYAIQRAAAEIAKRLRRYEFMQTGERVAYTTKTIEMTQQGNLVKTLPEDKKAEYPAFAQDLVQVYLPDGEPHANVFDSPVLISGDSFVMWFDKVSGGLNAHLTKELGIPTTNLPSAGGGPKVPRVIAAEGEAFLRGRRVVIWVMVSRYLCDAYAPEWSAAGLPE